MVDGDRRDVAEAINRIQRLSDDHWYAMDDSCRALDDNAWVGPAGRRFQEDVYAQRKELRAQLAKAVRSAREALQSLPRNR
jgi:hypothetical protein